LSLHLQTNYLLTTKALALLSNKESRKMQVTLQRETKSSYSGFKFITSPTFYFLDKTKMEQELSFQQSMGRMFLAMFKEKDEDKVLATISKQEIWFSEYKKTKDVYETFAHAFLPYDFSNKRMVRELVEFSKGAIECRSEEEPDIKMDEIHSYWLDQIQINIDSRKFRRDGEYSSEEESSSEDSD
jgi:hypothetical protein